MRAHHRSSSTKLSCYLLVRSGTILLASWRSVPLLVGSPSAIGLRNYLGRRLHADKPHMAAKRRWARTGKKEKKEPKKSRQPDPAGAQVNPGGSLSCKACGWERSRFESNPILAWARTRIGKRKQKKGGAILGWDLISGKPGGWGTRRRQPGTSTRAPPLTPCPSPPLSNSRTLSPLVYACAVGSGSGEWTGGRAVGWPTGSAGPTRENERHGTLMLHLTDRGRRTIMTRFFFSPSFPSVGLRLEKSKGGASFTLCT